MKVPTSYCSVVVLIISCSICAAQDGPSEDAGAHQASNETTLPQSANAVDLGTGELIRLDDLEGTSLVYGLGASQGYGWVSSETNGDSKGSLSLIHPNIGLFAAGRRTTALFQYAPSIDVYDGQGWDGSIFHTASADGYHTFSERTTLVFSGLFLGGSNAVRQIAILGDGGGNGGVDGLPYALAGNSTSIFLGSVGLHRMRTPRQEVSLTLTNSFSSEQGAQAASDTVGMRAQISSDLGRRSRWRGYLQADLNNNDPDRIVWILGTGFTSTFWRGTTVDVEGGPQFATGQRYNYSSLAFSGSLKQELTSRTGVYLTAQRDFNVSYLGQSRWADEFSTRARQQLSRSTFVHADVGYVRATDAQTGLEDRHGFYVGSGFQWRFSSSLAFISSYQYFKKDNPANAIRERHHWLLATLNWQPSSRMLHR